MTTHMPTLVSLRAFEAVARHKSFRKASEEICVTHAAVSHQVKALETTIGVQLLKRTSRSVELTPALVSGILRSVMGKPVITISPSERSAAAVI